ncbi:methylaspartate mutase [Spirillospora sp. CA-253888]
MTALGPAVPVHDPPTPPLDECVDYVRSLDKPTAADVLARAQAAGRPAVQPRCGVGDHEAMRRLLLTLERRAAPDLLTLTIDAHTRLNRFEQAARLLRSDPAELNGYPLVAHGWRRARRLNEAVAAPLQIRHGSPDPRRLFEVAIAAGVTSFEGGGISYNLPYSKDVPLERSLEAWAAVDRRCGELADRGVTVDRELFGTLTAVLVPPSISLAVSVLEAVLASARGVRCLSIAYPQGGHLEQDVAALRAIPVLASRYLPAGVRVHAVLHQFMGVFPRLRPHAEDLILYGAVIARLGGASKVVTKTYQEAMGIPDAEANAAGLRLAARARSPILDLLRADEERVRRELDWTLDEVAALVEPLLEAPSLPRAIVGAFAEGRLDIPFSASRHARSDVVPARDDEGAIRYLSPGALPLRAADVRRNRERVDRRRHRGSLFDRLTEDIDYFPRLFGEHEGAAAVPNPTSGIAI